MDADDQSPTEHTERDQSADDLAGLVAAKERRKLQARRDQRTVWYGLGMFGLVGWSIAAPTVLSVALGVWLDRTWPQRFSYTLMCLFMGVAVGCSIAWYWVKRESAPDDDAPPPGSDSADRRPRS